MAKTFFAFMGRFTVHLKQTTTVATFALDVWLEILNCLLSVWPDREFNMSRVCTEYGGQRSVLRWKKTGRIYDFTKTQVKFSFVVTIKVYLILFRTSVMRRFFFHLHTSLLRMFLWKSIMSLFRRMITEIFLQCWLSWD